MHELQLCKPINCENYNLKLYSARIKHSVLSWQSLLGYLTKEKVSRDQEKESQ